MIDATRESSSFGTTKSFFSTTSRLAAAVSQKFSLLGDLMHMFLNHLVAPPPNSFLTVIVARVRRKRSRRRGKEIEREEINSSHFLYLLLPPSKILLGFSYFSSGAI